MTPMIRTTAVCVALALSVASPGVESFVSHHHISTKTTTATTAVYGLFDNFRFTAGGTGNSQESLDEEWEKQQAILQQRRKPKSERDAYFERIEERRRKASQKQDEMWAWQSKKYAKGEDPIDEWKKRRSSGQISDLEDQYGDPKKVGGIPLPMPSFGVGGEFGVGGKFDNGGRFDLRLPYAEQGYVDEDADAMGKLMGMFGGGNKKKALAKAAAAAAAKQKADEEAAKKKKGGWPW